MLGNTRGQRANTAVNAEVNGPATFTKFPFPWPVLSTTSRSGEVPSTGRSSSSPSSPTRRPRRRNPRIGPHRRTHRRPGHQRPPPPVRAGGQFSLGKSRQGYGPMGMWVVTPDEPPSGTTSSSAARPTVSRRRTPAPATSFLGVPASASPVAEVSGVLPALLPRDLGVPGSLRGRRNPPATALPRVRVLESWSKGIGSIRNRCR